MKRTVVCEYVGFGHPDAVADQISDALLDEFLKQDPNTRAGIEVMVKDNIVVLGGEVKSQGKIDYDSTVRMVFDSLPYPANHHLSADEIKVMNLMGKQSSEISRGVDKEDGTVTAGDQGFVVAMASNETEDYMPLGMHIAKKICQYVAAQTELGFGPDCKSQVITVYDEKGHAYIDSILVSTMQQGDLDADRKTIETMIRHNRMGFSDYVLTKYFLCTTHKPKIIVNPNGEWRIGGSVSDCGITGRKIVVNQFGGYCPVGGGNFGGKDLSKIDRSAAYMCRYLAKNIVAAGISDTAKVLDASGSRFSEEACRELGVVTDLLSKILDYTAQSFEKRDVDAARHIEPYEEVMDDMVNALHDNHLARLREGKCNMDAGTCFLDVMNNMEYISDSCSNVGVAVVARVTPQLARQAHMYISTLHQGTDEWYNELYQTEHDEYFSRLGEEVTGSAK